MKVFKITTEDYVYAYSGRDEEDAKHAYFNETNWDTNDITKIEEIPESEWDKRTIKVKEGRKTLMLSIRDIIIENWPLMIYTNDPAFK